MPENTFKMAAVASAIPSMTPTVTIDTPSVVTMKIGRRLWIISEEMSMNSEPNPKAQMPAGNARHAAGLRGRDGELFEARKLTPATQRRAKRAS